MFKAFQKSFFLSFFTLIHLSGTLLGTADALSRLPLQSGTDYTPVPAEWTMLVNFLDWSPVTSSAVEEETKTDPILSRVYKFCHNGWTPATMGDPDLAPFTRRRDELSLQGGCVLWGSRVIIPNKLRKPILQELHSGHTGASRMKELARSYLWWPGLDKDLELLCSSCSECLQKRGMPPKAELHPWEWPRKPWHRIHIDHAGPVDNNYYLIVVDAHSKWVDIHKANGTTAAETIRHLCRSFANFGLPISVVSDNGPCFTSGEFKDFMVNCGVKHIRTAVYKPSTNGLAERMVQTFKQALKASKEPIQLTIDRFLFNYRLTPHSTTGLSPAELMFGRKLRSRLDLVWPSDDVSARVAMKQQHQKDHHAAKPRTVDYEENSPVMVKNYSKYGSRWTPAMVSKQTGPVSYRCRLDDGNIVKRHQDQIQTRSLPCPVVDTGIDEMPPLPVVSPVLPVETLGSPHQSPGQHSDQVTVADSSNQPATQFEPCHRSARQRRPVERLDL